MIMNDLKKKLMMKFSRIEYKHVILPEEYLDLTKRYKLFKKDLNKIECGINGLMNYEHNGSTMKKISHGLSVISTTSKLGGYTEKDVFENMAHVMQSFSESEESMKNISKGYLAISEQKAKFNEECKKELELLSNIKKKIESIDKERMNVKTHAYDLEVYKQSTNQDKDEHDRNEELFEKSVHRACSMMIDFLGENGINGLLHRVHESNLAFFKNCVAKLEKTYQ